MKAKPTKKKVPPKKAKDGTNRGRPKEVFDLAFVETLGTLLCTMDECASLLDVSIATISRQMAEGTEFCKAYKKGASDGNKSLRRTQMAVALGQTQVKEIYEDGSERVVQKRIAPSVGMLIWLGKQRLDQKDVIEQTIEQTMHGTGQTLRLSKEDEAFLLKRAEIVERVMEKSGHKRAATNGNGNGHGNGNGNGA